MPSALTSPAPELSRGKDEKLHELESNGQVSMDLHLALQGLMLAFHEHRTTIKLAFRYYTLVGASVSKDDDQDSMTMQQVTMQGMARTPWTSLAPRSSLAEASVLTSPLIRAPACIQFLNFAKSTHLLSEKEGMIGSDVDRIFMRSVRATPEGDAAKLYNATVEAMGEMEFGDADTPAGGGDKEWVKAKAGIKSIKSKGNNMMQHHFVGGLVRLSNCRFASHERCASYIGGRRPYLCGFSSVVS